MRRRNYRQKVSDVMSDDVIWSICDSCERRSSLIRRLFGKGLLRFLDIEEVPEFDGNWNQEISFRTFQKNSIITDCNDNRPIFSDFEIHFNNYRTNQLRSFYSELIGRVPARDPDVKDRLTYKWEEEELLKVRFNHGCCRFISGNDERLLLMDADGRLKLNNSIDSDRQFTVPITILVSGTFPIPHTSVFPCQPTLQMVYMTSTLHACCTWLESVTSC